MKVRTFFAIAGPVLVVSTLLRRLIVNTYLRSLTRPYAVFPAFSSVLQHVRRPDSATCQHIRRPNAEGTHLCTLDPPAAAFLNPRRLPALPPLRDGAARIVARGAQAPILATAEDGDERDRRCVLVAGDLEHLARSSRPDSAARQIHAARRPHSPRIGYKHQEVSRSDPKPSTLHSPLSRSAIASGRCSLFRTTSAARESPATLRNESRCRRSARARPTDSPTRQRRRPPGRRANGELVRAHIPSTS